MARSTERYEKARAEADQRGSRRRRGREIQTRIASLYLALHRNYTLAGKETEALEWLKRALVKDSSNVSYRVLADFDLHGLQNDPSFQTLLKQYLPELDLY